MTKKKLVTFTDQVWEIIEKEIMPKLGYGESEVIRTIVLAYLGEKGYLLNPKIDPVKNELVRQEILVGALVEVLAQKGVITRESWEQMVATQQ